MVCQDFFDLLDNYELLDETQRNELENHASLCPECNKELEFFRSIIETSATIFCPQPPKTLISDINARLDREGSDIGPFARFRYNIRTNTRGLATIAACLAVGAAVGLNSGYIKDRLTDTGSDGVINETVGETSAPEAFSEIRETLANSSDETETRTDSVKASGVTEGEAKSDLSLNSKTTISGAAVQSSVNSKPAETNTPQSTKNPSTVSARNDAASEVSSPIDTLEIHEEYHLPKNEVATATEEPTDEEDINSYSIANANVQYAYGFEDIPQRNANMVYLHDYLSIDTGDVGTVVSAMSEMGVKNSGDCFMTSRENFYRLLDRLNSQGVKYTCDLTYNSSDRISFKLMHD